MTHGFYFGRPSTTYERQFEDLSLKGFRATYCAEESNANASSIVAYFTIVIVFGGWPESVVPFAARTMNSLTLGLARAPSTYAFQTAGSVISNSAIK